jgi:glycosyltransferase involved in cell wall biosynthesis
LKNEEAIEKSVREKWQKHFKKYLTENLSEVESRFELSKFVEEICAREASSIIAVSPSVKDQIIKLFGINPKKIKVIINGIKNEWFKEKNNFAETPQIVFTSRFSESSQLFLEKGYDRALEIFKNIKYPKKAFIYFNQHQENEVEEIKRIIKMKTNTDIIANASRNQLLESHQPGQIFLSTARVEACQLTLLEAMASKMVPVTYSVGIAPTAIKNGVNGFIVGSIPEAIDIINNLSRHPELRKKIGCEAYQTAEKHFTFERMIKEYQDYFQSIF